jgi:regulator of protease activity HflC (stomatin/prohibitin superfamily)
VSDQGQPLPERGPGEPQASPRLTRRAKSITLRQGSEMESPGALMDAAHKSLADALRITFGLVQIGMVVLAALYVLSGFQSVKQNEQGIRLLFGKIDADGLEPGFQFSLPAPLGEMVKVSTGAESVDLDSEFWVRVSPADKEKPIDSLPKLPKLNPENEGAVLTGDGNVAHTQWKASYRRVKPGEYATSIMPTDEAAIVRAAVQRGVVQAVSQTSIEDLLKQSASERASVAANARDVAQAILDRARSGIVIEQLILKDKMPPLYVRDSFAKVQTAASNAGTEQDKARSEREQKLNKVAGAAAPALLALIRQYELQTEKNDQPAAEKVLATIYKLLDGEPVEVEDAAIASGAASGEVASILAQARLYRSEIVNQRQSQLISYQAKLEQYKSNPLAMVNREWQEAITAMYARENVQLMASPPGTRTLELLLNADPDILRELDILRKRKEAQDSAAERERKQQESQHDVDRSLKMKPK